MEIREQWLEDAKQLAALGSVFLDAGLPKIDVQVPRELAERAVAAWERNDDDDAVVRETETFEQTTRRIQAGTLALIGLDIAERGRWLGDVVAVELDPGLVGAAIEAADDLSA